MPGTYVYNGEGPFRASRGGVGAVVVDDQTKDPVDVFKSAYSIGKQLKDDREAEQAAKRKKIEQYLSDLDFSTTGIRSNDYDYFLKGKDALNGFLTHAIMQGADPTNPLFLKDYAKAQEIKRAYSVAVDASKNLNEQIKKATEELYKNPNKFDWDGSLRRIKEVASADLPAAVQMAQKPLLMPKGWDFTTWATGLFDPKKSAFKPEKSVSTNNRGQVIETTEYSKWDNDMKAFPKVQEIAGWALRNDANFRDYVLDRWDGLDDRVKEEYSKIAESATKNGNPITAEDYFAYQALEPFAYQQKAYKGETSAAKEANKYAFGRGAAKKDFAADIDRYLMLANGDASVYRYRDGGKFSQYGIGAKVGTYVDMMGNTVPDEVISIQHLGKTPEGRPIIKYKTTGTADHPGRGLVDQDGYITTNDPNDIIYPMIKAQYEKDAPKYIYAYQQRVKDLGGWKTGTIDPYAPDIMKLSPGYELENAEAEARKKEMQNPNYVAPSTGMGVMGNVFNYILRFTSAANRAMGGTPNKPDETKPSEDNENTEQEPDNESTEQYNYNQDEE